MLLNVNVERYMRTFNNSRVENAFSGPLRRLQEISFNIEKVIELIYALYMFFNVSAIQIIALMKYIPVKSILDTEENVLHLLMYAKFAK